MDHHERKGFCKGFGNGFGKGFGKDCGKDGCDFGKGVGTDCGDAHDMNLFTPEYLSYTTLASIPSARVLVYCDTDWCIVYDVEAGVSLGVLL